MRTTEQINRRAWHIALGQYLSEYPQTATPETVLEMIEAGADEVTIWEPFEYSEAEWIIEQIEVFHRYIVGELTWATGEES